MAIKHVVTMGFNYADGVKFIPPFGFSAGIVNGMPTVQACQVNIAGAQEAIVLPAGAKVAKANPAGGTIAKVIRG